MLAVYVNQPGAIDCDPGRKGLEARGGEGFGPGKEGVINILTKQETTPPLLTVVFKSSSALNEASVKQKNIPVGCVRLLEFFTHVPTMHAPPYCDAPPCHTHTSPPPNTTHASVMRACTPPCGKNDIRL